MNDLFSRSLREYLADDKCRIHAIDIEAGWREENETMDLDKFFEDVEKVEEDMKDVYRLYKKLQDSNEESKTVHKAITMKEVRARMDSDVGQVLKRVKVIKGKLEALDRANVAHQSLPGCGPRSSVDRARTLVLSGLGKKLRVMLDEFQALRTKISSEYKETIEKRYFIVTGEKANEEMIEILISTGESETFLQKVIQEQARGKILDTISEFQERHDTVKEIEMNLNELHQMFLDVAVLVEAQGGQVDDIQSHLAHASSYVRHAADKIQVAREDQKSSRKWGCIAILLGASVLVLIILPVLSAVLVPVL